ncbi:MULTISPECIES: NUDIX hydrolase [unclassified Thioalkalivibrio]|uniref:NUDIX hydrolase n=1 Tax=unclassified Thioalkalivibrio TaxID=2621013 RepID=UPI0003698746|nr:MULTISPECIES: NUDIX hydrolase [unclassified Thioalkalivibrio]
MIEYRNPWFRVRREGQYHWVEEPMSENAAAVLPLWRGGVLLLEQTRPAQGATPTLEMPRGYGEPGETALQCALRELREETGFGLRPEDIQHLGYVRPNTAVLDSRVALFVARVPDAAEFRPDQGDGRPYRVVPLDDLDAVVSGGVLEDGFTLSALAVARARGLLS